MFPTAVGLFSLALQAATPSYWPAMTPGRHAVGFAQRWTIDSTRRLPNGPRGLPFRPVLMNVWFPSSGGGTAMTYDDYFSGTVRAAGSNASLAEYAKALVAYERDIAWFELARTSRDSTPAPLREGIERLFRSRALPRRDATRPRGTFDVVIYTQGSRSSMDDNVVLCEYLASRGYLVVGSAFPQEDNSNFHTNATDESRQRDVRRLLLEVRRMPGVVVRSVTVIGHSAGAQAMQAFAADPSAPIDAVLSLDTTQDYAMLTDRSWAYFTDPVSSARHSLRTPIMFVAGPEALFELADSLRNAPRWLVVAPNLDHNDFISQGIIGRSLTPTDSASRAASISYVALVAYLTDWLDASVQARPQMRAKGPLTSLYLAAGDSAPPLTSTAPRTAREVRHLFATATPDIFAERVQQTRSANGEVASNDVLTMLLADAVRRGNSDRARAMYDALTARDTSTRRISARIESRARLYDRIGAKSTAEEWRAILRALAPAQRP